MTFDADNGRGDRWDNHWGGGRDNVIVGNGRDNVLRGTNRDDAIFGRGGDDVLLGRRGDDRLTGGDGADRLFGGPGRDTLVADRRDATLDGGDGRDTVRLDDDGTFDFRGDLAAVERIEQGRGDATLILDEDAFLTVDGDRLVIDLGRGNHDTLDVRYDGSELDIDREADGSIVFGPPGDLDGELVLVGVEHLRFTNTDTGASGNYDHWLA